MDKTALRTAAAKYGTPLYLFDLDAFTARAQRVRAAFGSDVNLCYSMKANPFVLRGLPDVFRWVEVCSPGELTICEKLGIGLLGQIPLVADLCTASDNGCPASIAPDSQLSALNARLNGPIGEAFSSLADQVVSAIDRRNATLPPTTAGATHSCRAVGQQKSCREAGPYRAASWQLLFQEVND